MRQCSSCGAVIDAPANEVATACAYCASHLVDATRGDAVIDRVAPFRVPKTAALDRLRQHLATRFWAPNALRRLAARGAVQAQLQGVLVPYYAYTAECRSTYSARVGVHWYRTEKVKDKDGKTRDKRIQETEWFPLRGSAVGQLRNHLECGSQGLTPYEATALRGFDFGRAVRFDPHLLAGWRAELPSRVRATVDREAVEHIRELEARRIRREVLPGDTQRRVTIDGTVTVQGVELVLLPVWITTYTHAGAVYRLLVHGQTGRCVGKAPVSRVKVGLAALAVAVLGVTILYLSGVLR
ncbi:MAG: hypothetical protein AAF721_09560 [Myxococcota bacterium]